MSRPIQQEHAGAEEVERVDLAVIGGGPAGLAAAEVAAARLRAAALSAPPRILVLEAMPSLGRKLLMAGKSGLNITHAAAPGAFLAAYRRVGPGLEGALAAFGSSEVRVWMAGLGQESFVGPSGRVFPTAMKASPLLRAWLTRLAGLGVETRARWRWRGFAADGLDFETPAGRRRVAARAAVLALGGASWPRLGADGAWAATLAEQGAPIAPFAPSNVGWEAAFTAHLLERFNGAPLKTVGLEAGALRARGALTITRYGLEGGPLYALTPALLSGAALTLDLAPDRSEAALAAALERPRGKQSFANWMRKAARLGPAETALLREAGPPPADPASLAARIKTCPIALTRPRPLAEAISTAGGLDWTGVTETLELKARPGVFAAGEMLAWDAPTGGYLLTACLALGRLAGEGAADLIAGADRRLSRGRRP